MAFVPARMRINGSEDMFASLALLWAFYRVNQSSRSKMNLKKRKNWEPQTLNTQTTALFQFHDIHVISGGSLCAFYFDVFDEGLVRCRLEGLGVEGS